METSDLLIATVGIALGGFIKGATGAGAPIVGVPILALVLDIRLAVAIFAGLNLLSNAWQSWTFRQHATDWSFVRSFAFGGAVGAVLGSVMLASLPTKALTGALGSVVFLYIALRLARPDWVLSREMARRLSLGAGGLGGVMQGAGGISAPVSVTFLNAMRMSREEFIATISAFFVAMSVFQVPSLIALGLLTWEVVTLTIVAAIPLFAAIPLGSWAARHVSKSMFDKIILVLLALIGAQLLWKSLT